MELEKILITLIVSLVAFAKGWGSLIWASFARGSVEQLLDDIGLAADKKLVERGEFFDKLDKQLTYKERDAINWRISYINACNSGRHGSPLQM